MFGGQLNYPLHYLPISSPIKFGIITPHGDVIELGDVNFGIIPKGIIKSGSIIYELHGGVLYLDIFKRPTEEQVNTLNLIPTPAMIKVDIHKNGEITSFTLKRPLQKCLGVLIAKLFDNKRKIGESDMSGFDYIKDELVSVGYREVNHPIRAGFIFPDGSIVDIDLDDHSVVDQGELEEFGIITYRYSSNGDLFIKLFAEPTDEQIEALSNFPIKGVVYIDIYKDGEVYSVELYYVTDWGILTRLYRNPKAHGYESNTRLVDKLNILLEKSMWIDKVRTKWKPPEGLFTKSPQEIAKVIAQNSKSYQQAVARVNFYYNRMGCSKKPNDRTISPGHSPKECKKRYAILRELRKIYKKDKR